MKKIFIAAFAMLFALSSCVEDKLYPYPSIADISNTIAYNETDDVTVTATVTAFIDVQEVLLFFKAGGSAAQKVKMTGSGNTFTGVIPAQPMGTEVVYYIEASTSGGTTTSNEGKYTVGVIPIDFTPLKVNELNGNDKFIEIINTGSAAINVKGIKILKDTKDVWTGPNRELPAGGFLLLYSEDVVVSGGAHEGYDPELVFSSGLSAKKAVRVQLNDPVGNPLDDFNLVTVSKTAPASYSRVPDGTGNWFYTPGTPGAKNSTDNSDPVTGLAG
ncbi:MAG: lamin tail domain-containing protein [Bacteroidales bacterium]|nr:lamin tail domain-containing protein [Bacteroidales bacterium]